MIILFMGTPDFAKECLKAIYESGNEIVGVVTTPDKPRGRGMVMTPTPVKSYALEKGLRVYEPITLRDNAFSDTLRELNPELIIVVAYGKILPKYVLDFAKYGCINAHASILPRYRGAAPIQRAIIDGEDKTGVSIMQMDEGLDTGDVILINEVDILENDNFESVHDKLILAGSRGLLEAISLFEGGGVKRTKQGSEFTYAEKITKEDCLIDFSKSSKQVHNQIRGLSPIPLAYTVHPDKSVLKITKARLSDNCANGKCGEIVSLTDVITVKCKDGCIDICELIPQGKSRMDSKAYINGRKLKIGDVLGKDNLS